MTATYVAVSAVAVLLTELVIFGAAALSPSGQLSAPELQARAQATAANNAAKLGAYAAKTGKLPSTALGTQGVQVTPGQAQGDTNGGVAVPWTSTPLCDLAPASVAVAVSRTGTVLASSYPACFPVGGLASTAQAGAPRKMLQSFGWAAADSGGTGLPTGHVVWAVAPIVLDPSPKTELKVNATGHAGKVFAMLYVEVPATGQTTGGVRVSSALIRTGVVVLLVAIPAGLVFGLLSTRRLTRRLKRLATLTLEVADGGFERRVPVSGYDEVSQLEENFNRMAGQLQA
jgi:HAMP domain-containing protein